MATGAAGHTAAPANPDDSVCTPRQDAGTVCSCNPNSDRARGPAPQDIQRRLATRANGTADSPCNHALPRAHRPPPERGRGVPWTAAAILRAGFAASWLSPCSPPLPSEGGEIFFAPPPTSHACQYGGARDKQSWTTKAKRPERQPAAGVRRQFTASKLRGKPTLVHAYRFAPRGWVRKKTLARSNRLY